MTGDVLIRRRRFALFCVLLFLVVVSFACSGTSSAPAEGESPVVAAATDTAVPPSPTPTVSEPTATAKPTQTPRPQPPTPEGLDAGWNLLMYDPFDGTGRAFPGTVLTTPTGVVRIAIQNGKSVWHATALEEYFGAGLTSTAGDFGDFFASVSARQVSGPAACEYGMLFRDSEDGGYLFAVQERARTFGLQYSSREGASRVFHLKQFSSAIIADGPNVLAVNAVGNAITLFINGTPIAAVEDDGSLTGTIGLRVFVQQKGAEADFEFDDFQVYGR
jgi:outer membrane protein assembly factor BamB